MSASKGADVHGVVVVADTTGYLPRELIEEAGIRLVSLYVHFADGRTEREIDMPNFDAFYEELRAVDELPTTSPPAVSDFVATYEPLLAEGRSIVSVHLSSGLSETCAAARDAATVLERQGKGGERVRVLDSATAGAALGAVVLAAATAASAGADLETVVKRVRQAREDVRQWFSVDTLEFLKRGGRIGRARAWVGTTLKIKPILTVESEITPVERVRTSERAFERLVEFARQRHAVGADAWFIQHTQAEAEVRRLVERCNEIFWVDPAFVCEIGPVVGTHTGPGLLGLGAITPSLLE